VKKSDGTIIGISIGSRTIGLAMITKDELCDWQLLSFKTKWSQEKKEEILEKLLSYMTASKAAQVVIKVPSYVYISPSTIDIVQSLENALIHLSIPHKKYSLHDINSLIQELDTNNKADQILRSKELS